MKTATEGLRDDERFALMQGFCVLGAIAQDDAAPREALDPRMSAFDAMMHIKAVVDRAALLAAQEAGGAKNAVKAALWDAFLAHAFVSTGWYHDVYASFYFGEVNEDDEPIPGLTATECETLREDSLPSGTHASAITRMPVRAEILRLAKCDPMPDTAEGRVLLLLAEYDTTLAGPANAPAMSSLMADA